ncbi:GntR family transcriptional regulator [Fodinicola acaciae]|uniref:GntR family transcriptional regulator n=1 Tax=Fodinicola acaciae TaxID=2681555 RepID=UPI0013D0634C|nr:GntR family transcriptional regulator [Fodinicola acaciae]
MNASGADDTLAPARRRGLADEVGDRIREAIFAGIYPPGAALREVDLATILDVSRGPVREALLRLEREGLVSTAWHRGATVTTLSPADIAELDSLRGALEQLAVQRVVAYASKADIAVIARTVELMERAEDEAAMVACDIAFHDAVYAAARHRRLLDAWNAIRSQVQLFLLTRVGVSSAGYLAQIPAEHRDLVATLRKRDAEAALRHFAQHRQRALAVLTESESAP